MKNKNHTIAVLPFVNLDKEKENEYFSDGITEDIISALSQIENLKVISRTSSFYFKDKNIPLKEIAKQLNASTILEGSVRTAGNQVRITAQLIEAEEDVHYWSKTWDRKMENIFDIQDEISLLIADKLREHLGHFEIAEHLVKTQTDSLDTYQLSLKARYHFNKWNPDDVRSAIAYWEQAISVDPRHTESYLGLADAYGFMATTEFLPREEAWQKAANFTSKAFKLDPNNAGAHYQLANLKLYTECDFQESIRHTLQAIEIKPNYVEAQQYMALQYIISRDMEKGAKHLQHALEIDPLNQETLFYQAYYNYRIGQFEKALDQFDEILINNPKNIPALVVKSYALMMLKRHEEVLTLLDEIPESIVMPDEDLGIRCLTYILKDDQVHAQKLFQKLKRVAEQPMAFQAHSYLFLAYANLANFDEAFDWLNSAMELKSSILLLSFTDPLVQDLKEDPRYAEFHKKLYPAVAAKAKPEEKKSPLLDASMENNYAQKLQEFMAQEEPYLNPGLTLRLLSAQLEINPNQLSWLLNERFGKNFNSFINDYRITRFKQLAMDPSNRHISLIGLAYESGFNSKTVFNTYFKKVEGVTPKAFLQNNS
jgi:adenylate cyclase